MTPPVKKLRVLVAEDSPVARRLLVHIVNGDSEMRVVGEAATGAEAVRKTHELVPDVILMDIGLPEMDGLEATRTIMASVPTPIVLISADYERGDARKTFEALGSGALTVLPKPQGPGAEGFAEEAANLTITLKLMADVKLVRRRRTPRPPRGARAGDEAAAAIPRTTAASARGPVCVVAIAASTGGPAALASLLSGLPGSVSVPILVVQHITPGFHEGLVTWLDSVTPLHVSLARDGEPVRAGQVVIAPPHVHLGVTRAGRVTLSTEEPIRGHRPSATYLFRSVSHAYGAGAAGIILTGMGDDGVAGLQVLKHAGGVVVAQDEATSVVYGMPREAAVMGLADYVVPLPLIPATVTALLNGGRP